MTDRAALREFRQAFGTLGEAETRTTPLLPSKVAPDREGKRINVIGHAATFDSPSVQMSSPRGRFTEYVDRRAFDDVLRRKPEVIFTWDHSTEKVMASTTAGNLELRTSDVGLRYYASVSPDLTYARDMQVLLREGVIAGSSFTFTVAPGGEEWEVRDGHVTRTIYEVADLLDVCVTSSPAYPASDAALARNIWLAYAVRRGYLRTNPDTDNAAAKLRADLELRRRRLKTIHPG